MVTTEDIRHITNTCRRTNSFIYVQDCNEDFAAAFSVSKKHGLLPPSPWYTWLTFCFLVHKSSVDGFNHKSRKHVSKCLEMNIPFQESFVVFCCICVYELTRHPISNLSLITLWCSMTEFLCKYVKLLQSSAFLLRKIIFLSIAETTFVMFQSCLKIW